MDDERKLMGCGHPQACLRPVPEGHPAHGIHDDYCIACWELLQISELIRRAQGQLREGSHDEADRTLDQAASKAFRPVRVKGKPLSQQIIEDRR